MEEKSGDGSKLQFENGNNFWDKDESEPHKLSQSPVKSIIKDQQVQGTSTSEFQPHSKRADKEIGDQNYTRDNKYSLKGDRELL